MKNNNHNMEVGHKSRQSIWLLFIVTAVVAFTGCVSNEDYNDTSLSFEQRVDDLVSQMTFKEKVSQLNYESPAIERLGIQEYNWWNECLHGVGRAGIATVFPQAIGLAAMWDTDELFTIANAISDEARAKHHEAQRQGKYGKYLGLTYWSPNINIFRDPRWGRGMETYGEDPYLSGELGVAFVKGLQGDDEKYLKLAATAKHFVAHSGPEGLRHSFNAVPDKYDFWDTYTPHFKKVVQEGNVYSVMCAYNRYNNKPCCGSKELESLLRDKWGFKGYIVSDCWAIRDFYEQDAHEVVNTKAEAAAMAVQAGTDLNCGNSSPALIEALEKGYVTEAEVDRVLRRLLLTRMKLGMFDNPKEVPYASVPYSVVDSKEHQYLAHKAACKSIVLLKNDNQTLPFSKEVKNVAVIGPNANQKDVLLGNYNGYPSKAITPLEGIRNKLPNATIHYAQGAPLAEELPFLVPINNSFFYTDSSKIQSGLKGDYYNNKSWKGKAILSRIDKDIDFEWWTNGPAKGINPDTFSVRWSGVIVPKLSGQYAIGGECFSGFNLSIDNKSIITWDGHHHSQKLYESIELEANRVYKIEVEYVQNESEYAYMRLLWEQPSNNLLQEALEVAQKSDVVVLCMGLSPMLEGEEMKVQVSGFENGDRLDIQLPEVQSKLIKAIYKLGKPTVLVLLNGSALAINWEQKHIPAIVEAWYPGQAGGSAIADVLFGDYNPSGRLPVTFYKTKEQLPDFKNYSMKGRTYRYFKEEPLYAFGHGLSYSTYEYSDMVVPEYITAGEELQLAVTVTNTGERAGDEVVQMYLWHDLKEYRTPLKSLKGFKRIHLKPGESQRVYFTIKPHDMAVLNTNYTEVIVAERLFLSVGGSQPNTKSLKSKTVVTAYTDIKIDNQSEYQLNPNQ